MERPDEHVETNLPPKQGTSLSIDGGVLFVWLNTILGKKTPEDQKGRSGSTFAELTAPFPTEVKNLGYLI